MLKAYPAVIDDLDLIDEEDQITHTITLEDAVNPENELSRLLEVPVLLWHLHGSSIRVEVEKLFLPSHRPRIIWVLVVNIMPVFKIRPA